MFPALCFGFFIPNVLGPKKQEKLGVPPVLKREYAANMCWNNAAIQFLLLLSPINNALIKDKNAYTFNKSSIYYKQGNKLRDAYIDLVDAVNNKNQKAIDDAQGDLYSQVCIRRNITQGAQWDPRETIFAISSEFKDLFEKYVGLYYTPNKKNNKLQQVPFTYPQEKFEEIMEEIKKDSPNLRIQDLPTYLIVGGDINDKGEYALLKGKKYSFKKDYYTNVAFIDQLNSNGGHFWTWIKDKSSVDGKWYKRDDLAPHDTDVHSIADLRYPILYLYKRKIPKQKKEQNSLDALGQAFIDLVK